ncbi:MAG: hypothetical protein R3358_05910, partial [Woeseiaceae bacterium]|nr:hypothetical protein [Woeseiaceae bacterium]
MTYPRAGLRAFAGALILFAGVTTVSAESSYDDLLELFAEWREFEVPPERDGAPDYTAASFEARQSDYLELRKRLDSFDIDGWPIPQQVDWHLVRAEMNGYDFNRRVLRPWQRDPAFYKSIWTYRSDVPGHEGPTHHAVVELWTYEFPLSDVEEQRLIRELGVIPPLTKQAQNNLTGNARDLFVTGIRDIREDRETLEAIRAYDGVAGSAAPGAALDAAAAATDDLIAWLEAEAPSRTGPSG